MDRVFLGTGLIGAGLAEAALGRGDRVRVWNRTAAKTAPLAALGAEVSETAEAAVAGMRLVHIALTADAAVDGLLSQIAGSLAPGAIVVDHSTTSVAGTAARADWAIEHGVRFLHAPVFMSPEMCRQGAGLICVAGPKVLWDAVSGALEPMSGAIWYLGESGAAAASTKLMGNAMILSVLGGVADVLAIARESGMPSDHARKLFAKFNLNAILQSRGRRMAEGDYDTSWSLEMARKDLGLMVEAGNDRQLGILPALGARMDALIDAGYGGKDVGVLARGLPKRPDELQGDEPT